MAFWHWVVSGDGQFAMLSVNADVVPPENLQQTKNLAVSLLNLDGAVDKHVADFPHGLHGGWPTVDPTDAFVTYAQIPTDDGPVSAMATGSSWIKRYRGVALALVMSGAIWRPRMLPNETVRDAHDGLSEWIAAAKREYDQLQRDSQTPCSTRRRSRSRSRSVADRGRPSSESELDAMKKKLYNAELVVKEARGLLKQAGLSNATLVRDNDELRLKLQRGPLVESESDAIKKKLRNAERALKEARGDLKRECSSNDTLVRDNGELRTLLQKAERRIKNLEENQVCAEPRGSSTAKESHRVRRKHGHGLDGAR